MVVYQGWKGDEQNCCKLSLSFHSLIDLMAAFLLVLLFSLLKWMDILNVISIDCFYICHHPCGHLFHINGLSFLYSVF